jgi:hypothetical protein
MFGGPSGASGVGQPGPWRPLSSRSDTGAAEFRFNLERRQFTLERRQTGSVPQGACRSMVHATGARFESPTTRRARHRWSVRPNSVLRWGTLSPSGGSCDAPWKRAIVWQHLRLVDVAQYQHAIGGRVALGFGACNDERAGRRNVLRRYLHDRWRQPLRHDRASPPRQLLQHRCCGTQRTGPGGRWADPVG